MPRERRSLALRPTWRAMPERRRSAWSALADDWSDDNPAIVRGREALQRLQEAPGRPEAIDVESTPTSEPVAAPDGFSRRERIAQLIARVQSGDLSAVEALRNLLDG